VRCPFVEDQVRHAVLVEAANLVGRGRQVPFTVHDNLRLCDRAPALVGKTGPKAKRKAAVGVDPGNDRAWSDLRERDAFDLEADADVRAWRTHEDQRGAIRSVQFRAGIARIGRTAAEVLKARAVALRHVRPRGVYATVGGDIVCASAGGSKTIVEPP